MIAVAAVKQIDILTQILLIAHRNAQLTIKGQIALAGNIVAARHALLLRIAQIFPAGKRLIVVGREAH